MKKVLVLLIALLAGCGSGNSSPVATETPEQAVVIVNAQIFIRDTTTLDIEMGLATAAGLTIIEVGQERTNAGWWFRVRGPEEALNTYKWTGHYTIMPITREDPT